MHHIISDGWSLNLFIEEVWRTYHSLVKGSTIPDSPLKIQYKDFSEWQRHLLASGQMDVQRQFWLDKLAGPLPITGFPTDFPRPKLQTFDGAAQTTFLSTSLTLKLQKLAQNQQATLFMVLITTIRTLIYHYSGQQETILGSPISCRIRQELENQLGLYANTLALRGTLSCDLSFMENLEMTAQNLLEIYEHQSYPFDVLVEELDLKRDPSRSPLFDIMVILQNQERAPLSLRDLRLTPIEIPSSVSKFDLVFNFAVINSKLRLDLEYNTRLFKKTRIERLLDHFDILCHQLTQGPHLPIKGYQLLTEQEQKVLIRNSSGPRVELPKCFSIMDLVREQTFNHPKRTAVRFGQNTLSYGELHDASDQVAAFLQDQFSIGPGKIVCLSRHSDFDFIISLCAILKSGATLYLLDPHLPDKRKAIFLEESRTELLIAPYLVPGFEGPHLSVLPQLVKPTNWASSPLRSDVEPAMLFFTSGSTGKPKGVTLSHRALKNELLWFQTYFQYSTADILPQKTAVSFVDCIVELLGPIVFGGTIYLRPFDNIIFDTDQLHQWFHKIQPTILQLVPSVLDHYLTAFDLNEFSSLRALILSGEPVKRHYDFVFPVYNLYGCSEGCALSTSYKISSKTKPRNLPIGKPIANTQIYILNQAGNLSPIGVMGMLHIGGQSLATHYLHNPVHSALSFKPSPLDSGQILYRTGDLGRWNEEGQIEYMGRADGLIKIRGNRIECGEIEQCLINHPALEKTCVLPLQDGSGAYSLAAYYTSTRSQTAAELRNYLAKHLPDYMIPTYWIPLPTLPLNENGKLNKQALPRPDSYEHQTSYTAPRNDTERRLTLIWENILGKDRIGIFDDFFSLGGHSLLATRCLSAIRREMGIQLRLGELFRAPTIANLSDIVKEKAPAAFVPICPAAPQEAYPLSHAQKRLWFFEQMAQGQQIYSIPFLLEIKGELPIDSLNRAFQDVIARHESLRTVFRPFDGLPKQVILAEAPFRIKVHDTSTHTEAQRRALVQHELQTPFNLEQGPLLRLTLFLLGKSHFHLLFNIHHIISDGWSLQILAEELFRACRQEATPPAPLPIHYKDYSQWRRELLDAGFIARQRRYWLEKLKGPLPVSDLPVDRARPALPSFNGSTLVKSFSPKLTAALQDFAKQEQTTLFTLLTTLLKILFFRYSGQKDFILGTVVAGRSHADLEGQIGFYVNTLALRDTISPESRFLEVLEGVSTTCIEAFDNQDYPFDKLVEEVNPGRELSHSPLFDILVVLQSHQRHIQPPQGLVIENLPLETGLSRFDLTFEFSPASDETGRLGLRLEYNSDLFEAARLESLISHFENLARTALTDPLQKVKRLKFLPTTETDQLCWQLNCSEFLLPSKRTVVSVFQEWVKTQPGHPALVFEDGQLTYRQLNRRANQVAHRLRSDSRVHDESLIGIFLERGSSFIIAILGVLKARAAYLPFDPAYPRERIAFMLQDSQCALVLLDSRLSLAETLIPPQKSLDLAQLSQQPETDIKPKPDLRNLAYTIYTSGSTGRPKAVPIEHGSLINLCLYYSHKFQVCDRDHLAWFFSGSFDPSVLEIFLSLMSGATLHVMPNRIRLDPMLIKNL